MSFKQAGSCFFEKKTMNSLGSEKRKTWTFGGMQKKIREKTAKVEEERHLVFIHPYWHSTAKKSVMQ